MGKGMRPCRYIARVHFDRIVPMFGFYVYERWHYEYGTNMTCMLWCHVYYMIKYECA